MAQFSWRGTGFGDLANPVNWIETPGETTPRAPGAGDEIDSGQGNSGSLKVDKIVGIELEGSASVTGNSLVGTGNADGGASLTIKGSVDGGVAAGSGSTVHVSGSVAGDANHASGASAGGGTVTIDGSAEGTFSASDSGTLTVAGTMTGNITGGVNGAINVGGDIIEDSITIYAGGSVTAANVQDHAGGTAADTVSGGTLKVGTYGIGGTNPGKQLSILAGGTVTLSAIAYQGLTITISGAGSKLNIPSLALDHNNRVTVGSGATETFSAVTLGVQANGSGAIAATIGGTVTLSGNVVAGGAGAGSVQANGGTLTITGALSLAQQAGSSGFLGVRSGGTLKVGGVVSMGAGDFTLDMHDVGSTFDAGPGVFTMNAGYGQGNLYDGSILKATAGLVIGGRASSTNAISVRGTKDVVTPGAPSHANIGSLTILGGGQVAAVSAIGGGVIASAGAIRIEGTGGTMSLTASTGGAISGASLDMGSQAGSTAGQLNVSDAGSLLSVTTAVITRGTVQISAGGTVQVAKTLAIAKQAGSGSVYVSGAASELDAKGITVGTVAAAASGGSISISAGARLRDTGVLTLGAKPAANSADTNPAHFGSGSLTVDGTASQADVGDLTIGGASPTPKNANGDPDGTNGEWTYAGGIGLVTLSNNARLAVNGNLNLLTRAQINPDGTETFQGGLYIRTGAGARLSGSAGPAAANVLQIDRGHTLVGHGLVDSSVIGQIPNGPATTAPAYALKISNSGTIEAKEGLLVLHSNVFGDGIVQVDGNATLEIGGFFDPHSTVTFAGSGRHTLILDDAPEFQGSIAGLGVGDRIILRDASIANRNAVVSDAIGDLDGVETLQIFTGTDIEHRNVFGDRPILESPVQGAAGNEHLDHEFFDVKRSDNGVDTVLTLTSGNPIDLAVGGPAARGAFGVDGTGIIIGIVSDSFNSRGGQAHDVAIDALPGGVNILRDVAGTDEGRAMAQIIHAIAPGAIIDFSSADPGDPEAAASILALQQAGCQIIVDDLGFDVDALMTEAINEVVAKGVTYVTSAGNLRINGAVPIHGHKADPLAIATAAMNWLAAPSPPAGVGGYLPAQTEPFSSIGATDDKPDLTAPDGGQTTFPLDRGLRSLNPFFGTSAAAPAVAAVAALMLQENPQLAFVPLTVAELLRQTAYGFGEPANQMGAGLVQAAAAVAAAAAAEVDALDNPPLGNAKVKSVLFAPAAGDVDTGQKVEIVLTMSEGVAITGGPPSLTLNDAGTATYDARQSNPATGKLVFGCTVTAGQHVADLQINQVNLNGGTVQDSGGADADFSAAVHLASGVSVNSPLKVTGATVAPTGELAVGQTAKITLALNEALTVKTTGGAPTLVLSNGATASYDAAASSLSAGKLVFDYKAGTNDATPDLSVSLVILPRGTTVRDAAGNNADFAAAAGSDLHLQVGAAFLDSVRSSEADGEADTGQSVRLTLSMSQAVTVNTAGGSPTLTLNDGGIATFDAAASNAGAGALAFNYKVASGQKTPTLQVTGVNLNGATIRDSHSVNATFGTPLALRQALSINSPLTVTSVTGTPASAIAGQTVRLTLTMREGCRFAVVDRPVAPTLTLNDGATATYDAAQSDPSTGTLIFDYVVGSSDSTANLAITAIDLGGVHLIDAAGYIADFAAALNVGIGVRIGGGTTGGPGNDTLMGGPGGDVLDGKAGADKMYGYGGNDTYLVDNAGDQVFEAAGGGSDTVVTSVTYTLAAGQEIETFKTTDKAATSTINLLGNALAQSIFGNAGANLIDGKGGADTMYGLGGDDLYFVDSTGDVVKEAAAGGSDTVLTSVSFTLTTAQEIETFKTTDKAATSTINLLGNALAQSIFGNAGANLIDGKGGADTMYGLGGNDTYYVDNAGDVVKEAAGGGSDTVLTSVTYTLTAGQEVETLKTTNKAGTGAIGLSGNALAQSIFGNAGDNLIDGKGGNDTLYGLGGHDTFRFDTALNASTNIASIQDFTVSGTSSDIIELSHAIYGALQPGALSSSAFTVGAGATTANQRVIYNSGTGALLYDADGNSGSAAVQFAHLSPGLGLAASSFKIVA